MTVADRAGATGGENGVFPPPTVAIRDRRWNASESPSQAIDSISAGDTSTPATRSSATTVSTSSDGKAHCTDRTVRGVAKACSTARISLSDVDNVARAE